MKACGIASSSLSTGEARPRVCRIFCPEPGGLRSSKRFGPFFPARGKRSLCRETKLDRSDKSVAILGQIKRFVAELSLQRLHRELARTGDRDKIMVLIKWRSADPSSQPKMEDDESADWTADGDGQADEWRLQSYVEIKNRVNDNTYATDISPVDTTSIVTKTDPIPMKDVRQFFTDDLFPGYRYAGHNNIRNELLKDDFSIKKDKRICRWALNMVDPTMRIQETCEHAEQKSQWHIKHLEPMLKNDVRSWTPSEDFIDDTTGEHLPVIGVRVFHGGAQAVVNTVAYY